ncbi:MAG: GrpB family protein [Planctomycetaceae bacterium]|nr:GrpB family protein [Planctomycetota bacterium]NUO17167.1 GrpB family protein [Planctomycetaceae bacterium]GIK53880.1 MAG: hypothetical protein BroJett014_28530 [Planctomycetota bacterium]
MTTIVEVVPYNPRWPRAFEEERCRLLAMLAPVDVIELIEHIGSTAVPGLAAKPVLDILLGVSNPAILDVSREEPWNPELDKVIEPAGHPLHVQLVRALARLGYVYRGEASIQGRLFFRKDTGLARTHHIHVALVGGAFWKDHLLFRDYLRAHPDWAKAYGELKRKMAMEHGHSRLAYTDAKDPLIQELMARAQAWRERGQI